LYADDTQLYTSLDPDNELNFSSSLNNLEHYIAEMGASLITLNRSVKNLGGIFDQCINMFEHATSVCRASYYHFKNIHCLEAFSTQESAVTVVHAFVTFRIDYCNSTVIVDI